MTYSQLALLRYVLEKVKVNEPIKIDADEKVKIDSMNTYFNNLILDIEEMKKKRKNDNIAYYRLGVEVNE